MADAWAAKAPIMRTGQDSCAARIQGKEGFRETVCCVDQGHKIILQKEQIKIKEIVFIDACRQCKSAKIL